MSKITIKALREAMRSAGVANDKAELIVKALPIAARNSPTKTDVDREWDALLARLQADRNVMRTNMHNRSPVLRPIYEEYIGLIDKAKSRIKIAQTHGTLAEATRNAALINAQRIANGELPGPTCEAKWPTWLAEHTRTEFKNKVTQIYASIGHTRGAKFMPFTPAAANKQVRATSTNLQNTFMRIRRHTETDPGTGTACTPYRALTLAAVRMAELELGRRLKAYATETAAPMLEPLPVNWLALLDAPMRRRLADAQKNPGAVTPDGLDSFMRSTHDSVRTVFEDEDARNVVAHPMSWEGVEDSLEKVSFNDEQG